jgi:membrane fusion protein, hemolysin D
MPDPALALPRSRSLVAPTVNRLPARRRQDDIDEVVGAFESETFAVFVRTKSHGEHKVLYVLVAMMVAALILISVCKVDRAVTGSGRVVPVAGSLYVQPLDKEIVHDIRVKVGDVVRKGQVLATLDPTFTAADVFQLQQKTASAKAQVARLEAERAGRAYAPASNGAYEMLQLAIWQQRQAQFRSALADFDARIRNEQASLARLQQDVATYQKRLGYASQLEKMYATLEKHGFGSKLKTLSYADARAEVSRLLADAQHQIAASEQTVASLTAQRAVYIHNWQSETAKELVSGRNALTQAQDELTKAEKLNQLGTLVAPADAVVLKIGKASVGSVTGPAGDPGADPLFTPVPLDAPLEADIDIDARDIGFIRVGDPVEIKLDAYSFLQHGTAKGVVETISEGSFTVGENNTVRSPFFKARVKFTDVKLHDVPAGFRLIPGMTLAADIVVGHRTILSYLVDGALRTGSEAMREP